MRERLAFWVGWRFYMARQSNRFISFISFASTAGIALGVAVLITVLSAMNGFEKELEQRLLGVVPHGELTGVNEPLHDWPKIAEDAKKIPGINASAPFVRIQGLIQKPGGFQGLTVIGITPELEAKVSNIRDFMPDAAWQALASKENNIVLGKGLADALGLSLGNTLSLYTPNLASQSTGRGLGSAKSHQFKVEIGRAHV